jgi:hypothetical protein
MSTKEKLHKQVDEYIIDTFSGWHSALYKVFTAAGIAENIGKPVFYQTMIPGANDYLNNTAKDIDTRKDPYVNRVFDAMKDTLGKELPCCFVPVLVIRINSVLAELIPNAPVAQPNIDDYLKEVRTRISDILEKRGDQEIQQMIDLSHHCHGSEGANTTISIGTIFEFQEDPKTGKDTTEKK